MRKIYLSILFLIPAFLVAQQSVTVSGTFTETNETTIKLIHDPLHLGVEAEELEEELKGGKFKISFKPAQAGLFEMVLGEESRWFYLEPGDDLKIEGKDELNGYLTFEGSAAAHNSALQELDQRFKDDFTDSTTRKEILAKPIDIFEIDRFQKLQLHKEFLKSHSEKGSWSEGFNTFMIDHTRYNYLAALMAYPIENANNSKIMRVVPLPQIMLDPIKPEMVNNPAAMGSPKYRSFLDYYITYQGSQLNEYNKFTEVTRSLEKKFEAAKNHLEGTPFLYYVTSYLLDNGDKCRPGAVRRIQRAIQEVDESGAYAGLLQNELGEHMAMADDEFSESSGKVEGQKDAEDIFLLYDEDGKKVTLKDFKGKVIYVDFWASWCMPCRRQFPASKELHARFSKKEAKQVVFLYISLDKSEADWKRGLEQNDIEGVRTYSPSNWSSEMAQYYRINSIPRYMIINKKGEVVDPNAKRPSEAGIYEQLIELINE